MVRVQVKPRDKVKVQDRFSFTVENNLRVSVRHRAGLC